MPPGLGARASTTMALERCWSEGPSPGAGVRTGAAVVAVAARGRLSAEVAASATRRVLVALFARAARRAFLAREVYSWAREAERAAFSSEAATAALEALSAVSEALIASVTVRERMLVARPA